MLSRKESYDGMNFKKLSDLEEAHRNFIPACIDGIACEHTALRALEFSNNSPCASFPRTFPRLPRILLASEALSGVVWSKYMGSDRHAKLLPSIERRLEHPTNTENTPLVPLPYVVRPRWQSKSHLRSSLPPTLTGSTSLTTFHAGK